MELAPAIRCRPDFGASKKLELVFGAGVVEKVDELGAEDDAESAHVKQEVGPGGDPSGVVETDRATRNETVQMEVISQSLVPSMKDSQETDPSVQMGPPEVGQRFRN